MRNNSISKQKLVVHGLIFLIATILAVIYYPSGVSTICIIAACSSVFFLGKPAFSGKNKKDVD